MNPFTYYPGNSLYNADYDGDEISYVQIPDKEKGLIGQVVIMTTGDKGPMFRKKGMRVLFVNRNSNITTGPVLVEDVILKEKFGFIVGKNIEIKKKFDEKDYFRLLGQGYTSFRILGKDGDTHQAAMVNLLDSMFDQGFVGIDNNVYPTAMMYSDIDRHFDVDFLYKYLLTYGRRGEDWEIIVSENVFEHIYFGYEDRQLFESLKTDERFTITKVAINRLKGKSAEEVEAIIKGNITNNIKKLNNMINVHIKSIAKDIPRSAYGGLGKLTSIIKSCLNQYQA